MRRLTDVNARSRRAAAVLATTAAVSLAAAPAADAWPRPPGNLPLSRACVPKKALSPSLRAGLHLLGGGCVPKIRYRISTPAQINPGAVLATMWCVIVNARPGAPIGTLMSLVTAARWCKRDYRFWAYIQYR